MWSVQVLSPVDGVSLLLPFVAVIESGVVIVSQGVLPERSTAVGAAAPYFYEGRRGRYAARLEALAKRARAKRLGLWRACPRTVYDPYRGIETRR